jgi:hypothetical protein
VRDRNRQGMTTISTSRASDLLFPIAAFLHNGGMPNDVALSIFGAALKKVSKSIPGRRMEHIGHPSPYADTVAMWVRNKRFLDKTGGPRTLRMEGPAGFAALVKSVARNADPVAVLSVLIRYGNVKRTRHGTYELLRPFFYTSGSKTMAYEPVADFLSDASSTLSKILKRSKLWQGPELFWLQTENAQISQRNAKRFTAFAKERGLVFLEELDDWLEANSDKGNIRKRRTSRRPLRRAGLGMFSIYTDGKLPHAGR